MIIKHLKNKTTIELSSKELDKYITAVNNLDSALMTLFECQDMYLSDLSNLETLRFRLTEVFGLVKKDYRYVKSKDKVIEN
tara:strand:- start:6 stop:248 length:243 start_codon:yes stop_codon:yes gene_type:complete